MKKAKVVASQVSKNRRLLTGKQAVWFAMGMVAVFGMVAVVVPASSIPGFNYIAQVLGIDSQANRNLTMADFASYAIGAKDNKIEALREENFSRYNSGIASSGQLSPFSTLSADRLAQAYDKNAKEALEMEKSLGGQIQPFENNTLGREINFGSDLLAKGFDPSKIAEGAKASYSNAMEALAAAAGAQAEAFGKPLKKGDLKSVASMVPLPDSNISNIVGTGNILSIAHKDDLLYSRIKKDAKALLGTSIFGSKNAEYSRTDTSIGRPVYGIFKDLGTSFFFSRYAANTKLPTAASDIASAAFDGGSPADQSIITKEEEPEAPSVAVNPEMELNQSANIMNSCSEATAANKELIASLSESIKSFIETMKTIRQMEGVTNENSTQFPGCCVPILGANNKTLSARHKWNYFLDGSGVVKHMTGGAPEIDTTLFQLCKELVKNRNALAGYCGITFAEPEYTCDQMRKKLRLGSCQYQLPGKCYNISIFGLGDATANLSNNDLERYGNLINEYTNREDNPLTYEEAMKQAALDVGMVDPGSDGDTPVICRTYPLCLIHVNEVLSKTFAISDILDIRGMLVEAYNTSNNQMLRGYDVAQLNYCMASGDMSECQDILDYYQDGVLEEKCGSLISNYYNLFIDSSTHQLKPGWTIAKIREYIDKKAGQGGQATADCFAIYLALHSN